MGGRACTQNLILMIIANMLSLFILFKTMMKQFSDNRSVLTQIELPDARATGPQLSRGASGESLRGPDSPVSPAARRWCCQEE